ncbi:uncharacterized protein P884DRAFT_116217 [Thermothelomyces heterothallicus CBS 202.75]|uniref:uncharacterized protein n=1 Tax=Thermothelomyces heterothallicus CBS 202.75 TaxID=1149848 RepID=UPI003741F301
MWLRIRACLYPLTGLFGPPKGRKHGPAVSRSLQGNPIRNAFFSSPRPLPFPALSPARSPGNEPEWLPGRPRSKAERGNCSAGARQRLVRYHQTSWPTLRFRCRSRRLRNTGRLCGPCAQASILAHLTYRLRNLIPCRDSSTGRGSGISWDGALFQPLNTVAALCCSAGTFWCRIENGRGDEGHLTLTNGGILQTSCTDNQHRPW